MSVRYKPDIAGTGRLMRSPEMQAVLREAANKGVAYAVSISPERTGEYKSSFRVSTTASFQFWHDRAAAVITNESPHAALVEWQDNCHVLARTADYVNRTGV